MTVDFAGIKVDNVTLAKAIKKLEEFVAAGTPHLIVTPNPEMIVGSQDDAMLKQILNNADLRLPDGISMVVVSRILGKPLKERVSGIDFLLEATKDKKYKIFLLGSAEDVVKKAAEKLGAAGYHHGYFKEDQAVISEIKKVRPDILFAGLGGGRQEKWLAKYLKELNVPVCMGVGGSLDVVSGIKKRAPVWIQKLYIEWLYRLIMEPWRWKRQLALPKFLWYSFTRWKRRSKI
ncbi:hypothetical protein A2276_05050 [candidate division WOR-1 bacterium RIFOXYA12_FULL_43_27]|uniref:Uncharacterized protein n=1 Tax=candidate division WOR-1 bacterium RIFOXYC2_FULL_46_14 TaxID=1802587 RepID=A0A1F4UA20_UNCSA|nr:MAG: hypothetical protein A2276_05050 [candidate division WOR-1 bacterium RIFOXYA12_FULL_43_27]OGC20034.1 MAG: hypothetical protein A2292_03055 [candidate division WOR-1 bacterium RIFOXYB2_FULL_46_45]OGC32229.1 MAG: hypothetical protein A2232_08390 [candidate division WOR-1 bacterium RIFOXYA2_FULL_46_56]OGC41133.1 MAG: hypothetical protein A2438_07330 [candidate division WOR-1 bacterium RIFOXYC2_FULL_46_14]